MERTVSYTVFILHTPVGYQAVCPAFPHLNIHATRASIAYARAKAVIKDQLRSHLATANPIPRDPVLQTKTLRIDLWYLSEQEELR